MENYIGKICPFCKTAITAEDAVRVCPACGIPHHAGCWEENHGCTTFGCSQQHYEAQHTNPTAVCTNCGAPLGDGQAFCPKCGTPKAAPPQPTVCTTCGAPVQEGQGFCSKCGSKIGLVMDNQVNAAINQFNANIDNSKKKKNILLPIILAIALVVTAIFGGVGYSIVQEKKAEEAEQQRQAAAAAYIEDAKNFYLAVLASGSVMEDIGNEIQTSWKAYVTSKYYNGRRYYSVDSAVAAAISYKSADVTKVKNAKSDIESQYRDLLSVPDTSNQELMEIKAAVKETYDAYQEMYECVIDPSGNYNTWTSEFSRTDSALAEAIGDMRTLVN